MLTPEMVRDMEESARILKDPKAVQYFCGCADGYQAGFLAGLAERTGPRRDDGPQRENRPAV